MEATRIRLSLDPNKTKFDSLSAAYCVNFQGAHVLCRVVLGIIGTLGMWRRSSGSGWIHHEHKHCFDCWGTKWRWTGPRLNPPPVQQIWTELKNVGGKLTLRFSGNLPTVPQRRAAIFRFKVDKNSRTHFIWCLLCSEQPSADFTTIMGEIMSLSKRKRLYFHIPWVFWPPP